MGEEEAGTGTSLLLHVVQLRVLVMLHVFGASVLIMWQRNTNAKLLEILQEERLVVEGTTTTSNVGK